MSGQRFGHFIYNGKQYDVIGQLTRDFRSRPDDLGNLTVRTMDGSRDGEPRQPDLDHASRAHRPSCCATTATPPRPCRARSPPGRSLSEGIAAFEAVARETLDERFTTTLTGSARDFVESSSSLGWVLVLALVLIYLVLAAQFESFIDPLVILLTVPLALAGALLALWYFGQTLNIFSQIGLIMLVGLVAKNGILIVEFANQRRAAGAPSALAAVQGGRRRAVAPDPDDDAGDDPRHAADRARARRRRREPDVDGHRGHRRPRLRRRADAVRDSRDVRACCAAASVKPCRPETPATASSNR